jgi:excinuclease UvrABC helicase subunit UvrB
MLAAAKELDFEKATELRDKIRELEKADIFSGT